MALENREIHMDAGRVCDAIAKIGYMPVPAIMDIVDNSVAADATSIQIEVEWNSQDLNFRNKNNVISYTVVDNGVGMTVEEMSKALQLGSDVAYGDNSLSKYGMGLKSAGLSLGKRIDVYSKKSGVWSPKASLDSDVIKQSRRWLVGFEDLSSDDTAFLDTKLRDAPSGTIIVIRGCEAVNQDSAKKTIAELERKLGVVYQYFLKREMRPIEIALTANEMPHVQVKPKDLLFLDVATEKGFNPDTYDCYTPVKVLETEIALSDREGDPKAELQVVIFPQKQMSNFADFTPDQRERVKSYDINRENKGFFIYRNDRLIRWGDSLDGIVDRDLLGFRAKLRVYTAHDDVLHVDVSKQHLNIPEDILEQIDRIVRNAKRDASEAFKMCSEVRKMPSEEGLTFNEKNDDLTEEDPLEAETPEEKEEAKRRRKKLREETKKNLQEDGSDEEKKGDEKNDPATEVFEKIRYSHAVPAEFLWVSHNDVIGGSFVRVNRNHAFYSSVLSQLENGAPERQAMEAIFWAAGAAENATIEHERADYAALKNILDGFKKRFSYNLSKWSQQNQDIFE